MDTTSSQSQSPGILRATAAFVIIVAGMRAAQSLVVPFLLAGFIAIICAQPLFWLRGKNVPVWLSLVIISISIIGLGVSFGAIVGDSITRFSDNLPFYQSRIESIIASIGSWLEQFGFVVPADTLSSYLNAGAVMSIAGGLLSGLAGILSNGFMLILTVIFILLEAVSFPVKIKHAFADPTMHMHQLKQFITKINRYMAIRTLTSLATGVAIAIWLVILGVDFPFLWGLLAFLLNYVPSIGSIIAAVPAVLLSLIQLGPGSCILTAVGYLVVNNVIGTFLEPRFMGKGVGLSTLVVFISLVFWGWVLGPVGMFLSVPLTMIVKLALESNKSTQWMAILLGSEQPVESEPESAVSEKSTSSS